MRRSRHKRWGYDAYQFTGELTAFDIPERWAGKTNLWIDDKKRTIANYINGNPHAMPCPGNNDTGNDDAPNTSEESGDDAKDEPDDDSGEFCPFRNYASFEADLRETFSYRFATNEGIELRDSTRVDETSGTVRSRNIDSMGFAGEVNALRLTGAGHAEIHPIRRPM